MPDSLIVFPSPTELADTAAETIAALMQDAIAQRQVCHVALSGGGTPRPVYKLLGTSPLKEEIDWSAVHIWWADERCVPPDDAGSNFYMAQQVLLTQVSIPVNHIHRMRGEWEPTAAVTAYTAELATAARLDGQLWPRLDVAIMGLGSDGHTASLFPGPIPDEELVSPVISATADYDGRPAKRLTLTPLVFNAARHLLFLVTGKSKQAALAAVLESDHSDFESIPTQRIRPTAGQRIWLVDQAAAPKKRS